MYQIIYDFIYNTMQAIQNPLVLKYVAYPSLWVLQCFPARTILYLEWGSYSTWFRIFYFIQFTAQYYNQYIDGDTQASFVYPFMPSELFNSRAFGFTLNIYYKDVVSII